MQKISYKFKTKKGTYAVIGGIKIAKSHCMVWTHLAAACYLRNCNCQICPTKNLVENLESAHRGCLVKYHVRAYFFFGINPGKQIIKETKKMIKNMEI